MAFQFRFAQILRLKDNLENRERRLLEQIQREVSQTERELAAAKAKITHAALDRLDRLAGGITASEAHSLLSHETALTLHLAQVRTRLEEVTTRREQQLQAYQGARREKETFESLRKRQYQRYSVEEKHQEQKTLDDLFRKRP
jgi:flagellar FliJ protein